MLHSIQISNWKGHDEFSLSFKEGVNFLTGPNGIGKTSILDAICFAFLGNFKHIGVYHDIDYKKFVRDSSKDSKIVLSFSPPNDDRYEVARQVGTANRATLKQGSRTIATRWQEITKKMLELYQTEEFFFSRFIFLSEGDTYQYIHDSPGKGLRGIIERLLGIDRMEVLKKVFTELNKKHSDSSRNLRNQIASLSLSSEKDKANLQHLMRNIESLEQERSIVSNDLSKLNAQRNKLVSQTDALRKATQDITNIMGEWQQYFKPLTEKQDLMQVVQNLSVKIEREYNSLSVEKDQLSKDIGRLSALIDSQNKIAAIVQPLSEAPSIESVCPVCKRPLTEHMIEEIRTECSQTISSLSKQMNELQVQSDKIESDTQTNRSKANAIANIDSRIRYLTEYNLETVSVEAINKKIRAFESEIASLDIELEQLKERESRAQLQLIDARVEQQNIQKKVDPDMSGVLRDSLLFTTKVEILSQAFLESMDDTVAKQLITSLSPMTKELSKMWGRFLGSPVNIELGDNLELRIHDERYDVPFEFPQLSGGEKTALLILTQILFCEQFSGSDFMLIDEPLEHLDSRNQWSLINFLVQSCKRGFPKQLVITTIEEPSLREYLDDPDVQVTSLG